MEQSLRKEIILEVDYARVSKYGYLDGIILPDDPSSPARKFSHKDHYYILLKERRGKQIWYHYFYKTGFRGEHFRRIYKHMRSFPADSAKILDEETRGDYAYAKLLLDAGLAEDVAI